MSSSRLLQDHQRTGSLDYNNNKTKLNIINDEETTTTTTGENQAAKLVRNNTKTNHADEQELLGDMSKVRLVRLRQNEASSKLGFSLRGGKESTGSSVGVFVSHVESHSEADRKGLKIGDQLLQVNGLNVDQATYEMVIHLIKQTPKCNDICLKVNNLGRIPFQEKNGDPIKWLLVSDLLPVISDNQLNWREQFITGYDDGEEDCHHHNRKEATMGSSSSCDEGLESYNGSQRLANSLSTCELSESEQKQLQKSSRSLIKSNNNNNNLQSKAKGTSYHHRQISNCEHDSSLSSGTITTNSLDTQSTCSSNSSSTTTSSAHTIESSAVISPSSSACSISISSIHSSSAASTGSGSVASSEYERPAANLRHELKETLVRVPGGRRTSETFGCGVVKGPDEWPGIFVQSVKQGSLAERVGLKAGDQLTRADGQSLNQLTFDAAISLIKRLQQQQNELKLHIKKGAALRYLAEQNNNNNSSSGQPRVVSRQPEVAAAAAAKLVAPQKPREELVQAPSLPEPVVRSRKNVPVAATTRAAEFRDQNDKIYGVAERKGRPEDDVSVVELYKWRQAKVENEACKRQQPAGIRLEQKQLAADPARKQPVELKQVERPEELSPKQQQHQQQREPKGAASSLQVNELSAKPEEGEEEKKQQQQVATGARKSVLNDLDQDISDEDNGSSSSSSSSLRQEQAKGEEEEPEIRIVSQNCKLHYNHQSMQNYKQNLVLEKFKQRPATQQTDENRLLSEPKQPPTRPEPPKARRRVGQQQQQQVEQQQEEDACAKRQRQLLIDERMSSACCSSALGQQQQVGNNLQRYVSVDCLSVCGSGKPASQQRRLRSSSATRHHQLPMASSKLLACNGPQVDLRQQQQQSQRMSHQRASSVLGHRIQQHRQAALRCCDDLGSCLASSRANATKNCSRTMASRTAAGASATKCCHSYQSHQAFSSTSSQNYTELGRYSTLDSPMPSGLSRSKAHSMDKLNMNINLNYVKIGLANSYRALHAGSPRLVAQTNQMSGAIALGTTQQSHHLHHQRQQQQQQQFYNQQRRLLLASPCRCEEICCNRLACSPLLQQQQRRIQPALYHYAPGQAAGSRGGKLRQQVAVASSPAACCQVDLLKGPPLSVANAARPYCTALSKQQLRKTLVGSCQTLSHHHLPQHQQQQQQHQRVISSCACCQSASGHPCRGPAAMSNGVYCARPTVDRQQLCRPTARSTTRVSASQDRTMLAGSPHDDGYDISPIDYHLRRHQAESQKQLVSHRRQAAHMQQQVERCNRASGQHLKIPPAPHARPAPVPPPLPPMSTGCLLEDRTATKAAFQSPRDTRQRLSTFLSSKNPTSAGYGCPADSTIGGGNGSTIVTCSGSTICKSPSQESASLISTDCISSSGSSSNGEQPPAILLSHRQCRSSPLPKTPLAPRDKVAVPCPPPPPVPDAEFDYKIGNTMRVEIERLSNNRQQQQQLQQISESKQPPRFRSKQQAEVASEAKSNLKVGASKQNRLCFVDELKMLADRQQQQELAQQKQQQPPATGGAQSQVNSTVEPSATLIKIINASKSAQRAAAAAAAGSCGCRQNCPSCSDPTSNGVGCSGGGGITEAARCVPNHRCPNKTQALKPTQESKASVKLQDQDSKRRQHEMLMKEFKSAHSKMFSKRRNANLELDEAHEDEHESKDIEGKKHCQEEEEEESKGGAMVMARDQAIKSANSGNRRGFPGKLAAEPPRDTNRLCGRSTSPPLEVTAAKRTTIKTINTRKINLLAQSNPLHVAAAN